MSDDRPPELSPAPGRWTAAPLDGRFTPRQVVIAATLASGHLALFAWGLSLLP